MEVPTPPAVDERRVPFGGAPLCHTLACVTDVNTIAGLIRDAQNIVVLTGAGISTGSGIPDFRGPEGVWTRDPTAERRATIQHYVSDAEHRKRSWRGRAEGGDMWRGSGEPNPGHYALAELERKAALDTLVTQNVDGLHHLAGNSPEKIVEIHGNVREVKCLSCGWRGPMEETLERVRAGDDDPQCLDCGGMLKSATISFGENLVVADLDRAMEAAARSDVFLAVGTSLVVYPVARMPELALRNGAELVILNDGETPFDDHASAVVGERLEHVLPVIVEAV
jgi:NAD-dependent deacetylase